MPLAKLAWLECFAEKGRIEAVCLLRRQEVLADMEECNRWLSRKYGIQFSDVLPDEQDEPLAGPDPAAIARAMARLSQKRN